MNYSTEQLANITALAGGIVYVLNHLGIGLDDHTVAYAIGVVLYLGGLTYGFYKRYKKGDLTLAGFRKET